MTCACRRLECVSTGCVSASTRCGAGIRRRILGNKETYPHVASSSPEMNSFAVRTGKEPKLLLFLVFRNLRFLREFTLVTQPELIMSRAPHALDNGASHSPSKETRPQPPTSHDERDSGYGVLFKLAPPNRLINW